MTEIERKLDEIKDREDKEYHKMAALYGEDSIDYDLSIKGYLYVIKTAGMCKIGVTSNPKNRIKKYITENPFEIEIISVEHVYHPYELEENLHEACSHRRLRGEWFNLSGDEIKEVVSEIHRNKTYEEFRCDEFTK